MSIIDFISRDTIFSVNIDIVTRLTQFIIEIFLYISWNISIKNYMYMYTKHKIDNFISYKSVNWHYWHYWLSKE